MDSIPFGYSCFCMFMILETGPNHKCNYLMGFFTRIYILRTNLILQTQRLLCFIELAQLFPIFTLPNPSEVFHATVNSTSPA